MGEPNFWIPFFWKGQKELIWWSVGENGLRATFRTVGLQGPNAILYVLRTGCQWTDLPHDFPPWKSVYSQFLRWRAREVFIKLNEVLRKLQLKVNVHCHFFPGHKIFGIFHQLESRGTKLL